MDAVQLLRKRRRPRLCRAFGSVQAASPAKGSKIMVIPLHAPGPPTRWAISKRAVAAPETQARVRRYLTRSEYTFSGALAYRADTDCGLSATLGKFFRSA